MSAVNPYAPPQAGVADLAPTEFSRPRVWSYRGRIGRLRYLAYTMVGYFAAAMIGGIVAGLAAAFRAPPVVFDSLAWVLIGGYLVLFALATIQRSHDMGWSGWSALGSVIPLVNFAWLFKRGEVATNPWGAPPPPNGIGVKIGAGLTVIVIIGIVAAIALPAYQSYQQRAKAAAGS